MWLTSLTVLLGQPAPGSAEAVFKAMEQPVLKGKTFRTDVEIATGKDSVLKGRLLVAQGNKMRLELAGSIFGKAGKMTMVSDGTRMRAADDRNPGKDQDATKQLTEIALASVTRGGIFVPIFQIAEFEEPGKKADPFDLDKQFAVSDLKLGKKEVVAGAEAQALDYKLTMKSAKAPLAVTVWIDVKTHLPVKRVVTMTEGKETFTVTETYTKTALDDKIDDKEFAVPK